MNSKQILFTFILTSVLISCKEQSKSGGGELSQDFFVNEVEAFLDNKVPMWQDEYNVPCVGIGLIEDGKSRFVKVYGEHKSGQEAPRNTIFNVASITKAVVAMAVLKLCENKEWDLDEPLSNYWIDPDIKEDSLHKKLTTRHALSHTTGFKNWRRMHPENKLTFDFSPGDRYQYSGEGFEYMAKAIENKFNIGIERLVDSLVFKPSGMTDATMTWLADADTLRFAHWYDGYGNPHDTYYKTHWISAADDLLVTVDDLVKFSLYVMNSADYSEELKKEMMKRQSKIHENADHGLGWAMVELSNGEKMINHDGGDSGVATSIMLFPGSKNGIMVFTNADNGRIICNNVIRQSLKMGDEVVNKLYWSKEPPLPIEMSDESLQQFAGIYTTNLDREIKFMKLDNALKIEGEGIPQLRLLPENDSTFFPLDFEIQFVFEKDHNGNAERFKLKQGDKVTMEGVRTADE